ncbi:MAG: hypothetical protein NTW85_13660 [Methylococcales bacterium]|nr:hypothetical protein [Methylococcales bacterium]
MIISPETVIWLITRKKSVNPLKLLKIHGIELTGLDKEKVENERKNIENILNEKHKPTVKTIETFKNVVEILIRATSKKFGNEDIAEKQIQRIRDYSQPKNWTILDSLNKVESDYDDFFQYPNFKNSFIYSEIKQGVKIFRECWNIYLETESDNAAFDYLYNNDLFKALNLKDSITFDLSCFKIGGFNLNFTLYLIACMESEYHDKSLFSPVIKTMLSDIENGSFSEKSPFKYFTDLSKEDTGLSFEDMSEKLCMDERTFYRYRAGKTAVNIKYTANIINKSGLIYYIIVFIKGLLSNTVLIAQENQFKENIINIFREYDTYYEIAKSRFTEYKNGVEVIYSTPST